MIPAAETRAITVTASDTTTPTAQQTLAAISARPSCLKTAQAPAKAARQPYPCWRRENAGSSKPDNRVGMTKVTNMTSSIIMSCEWGALPLPC